MLYEVAIIEVTKGIVADATKGIMGLPAMPTGRYKVTHVIATNPDMAKAYAIKESEIMGSLGDHEVLVKVRAF